MAISPSSKTNIENSLARKRPDLKRYWSKRNLLKATEVAAKSHKKVWWTCPRKIHADFEKSPDARQALKMGCPECGPKRSVDPHHKKGSVSILAKRPELEQEWHYSKNNVKPHDVAYGSRQKYWWKCLKRRRHPAYEKSALLRSRGQGCPRCWKENPQQKRREVKPESSVAFKRPDLKKCWSSKNELAPLEVAAHSNKLVWWKCPKGKHDDFQRSPAARFNLKFGCPECAPKRRIDPKHKKGSISIFEKRPDLEKEWNYRKNKIDPRNVPFGSNKKYWWKCQKSKPHRSYEMTPGHRMEGKGCPPCGRERTARLRSTPEPGQSFADEHPELVREWSPKNKIGPYEVKPQTHKRILWKCPKNKHPDYWKTPNTRISQNSGCKKCGVDRGAKARATPTAGQSVGDLFPTLRKEWMDRNDRSAYEVKPGSDALIWWQCSKRSCGAQWQGVVKNRCHGAGCHTCNLRDQVRKQRTAPKEESLGALHPKLRDSWDAQRNFPINPFEVYPRSSYSFHWICPVADDHRWQAKAADRVGSTKRAGTGCPFCETAQRPRASSTNNITLNEHLMRYFAHDLNDVDPKTVAGSANVSLWWRCPECKHEWKAKVNSRYEIEDPIGCRACNPKQRSKREIRLQEELAWALEENLSANSRNIRCSSKSYAVDIVSDRHTLVVEYDGAYWHKDKAKMDRKKSSDLRKCGWTVIRAREYPLKKLGKNDVLVETEGSIKSVADAVLFAIGEALELWTPKMQTYVTAQKAKATRKSDAEIQKVIKIRT